MGEVYRARDTRLGREVAIKVLPEDVAASPEARARLEREARAISRLNHPHICSLYDIGRDHGADYLVLELIPGDTLAARMEQGALPETEVIRFGVQIAEALEAAHRAGVIHRDLKPQNLIVTPGGNIKVVDFGLARESERGETDPGPGDSTRHRTSPGTILGTVQYMSPEHALGQPIDARSDIFSLGIILFQLVTGRLPFDGAHPIETLVQIAQAAVPPLDPGALSPGLERVLRRCLEKDPPKRFPSMADVAFELARVAGPSAAGTEGAAPLHNLATAVTSFIGREAEIEDLTALLGSSRLVTITGVGGSGKTRLAMEVARRSLPRYPDGVRQVSLGPATTPALVGPAVAEGLGLADQADADRSPLDRLVAHAADRETLLVLDDCEHVVDEVARLVAALLTAAPKIRILATSRESLNVAGERVWPAPPLAIPSVRVPVTAEAVSHCDSVRLFVERAAARDPRFTLTDENAGSVATICTRLDGIPLAIELAAARVSAMSPAEICRRLDDCFRLLGGEQRGVLARHQTLRAALDWSHDLLTLPERVLYRRLAVFSGGFDLDAAEAGCGLRDPDPGDVLHTIARLVEKSLVDARRDARDRTRYRLLEPLRQYAEEKLRESGESARVARSHFEHYAAVAERAYAERTDRPTEWIERLERDHDNLRAALAWAAGTDPALDLRLAGALAWFWHMHAHFSEGREALRRVLGPRRAHTREVARALSGAGMLAVWQGDLTAGAAPAEEALAIWRELGDTKEIALSLEVKGWSRWFAGDVPGAMAALEESLALFESLGAPGPVNRAKLNICQVLVGKSEVERAARLAREALSVAIEQRNPRDIHFALHYLADCALITGDVRSAEVNYADSLRAAIDSGDRSEMCFEVEGVAMALAGQGRDRKAVVLVAAVRAERTRLGVDVRIGFWDALLDRYATPARARLGSPAVAAAEREGCGMGFEAAMEYALSADRE